MQRGLIIGKFLPFHEGHRHLIDSARAQVDELHVLVCTLKREIIPGARRHAWMREHYAHDPGIRVVHNPDENPQEPHEDPDFWEIWRTSITRFFLESGPGSGDASAALPEILFSSETYGDELARVLGMRHVLIDLQRTTVPVSGTAIREEPYRLRAYLPETVRPYFMKKIVITGPESCGKTTLAERLARHYGAPWCHEFAREYLERQNIPVDELRPEHIPDIARGQAALEDRLSVGAARENSGLLFLDTDLLVTKVYAEHYFGECPPWILDEARRRSAEYDLQLILAPEAPWVADPLRNLENARSEMFISFEQELLRHDADYRVLRLPPANDLEARFEARFAEAVRIVDEVLARPLTPPGTYSPRSPRP